MELNCDSLVRMKGEETKNRKIILKIDDEKMEIVYNDKDKGIDSSSKRKSSDHSSSSSKRKKSSEMSLSSSKHKSSKKDKIIAELFGAEDQEIPKKSSSSSSKHKTKEKHSTSKKSSSSQKSEQNSDLKNKSSDKNDSISKENCSSSSKSKSSEKSSSIQKTESESKQKPSEKSKENSSDQTSSSSKKHKSPSKSKDDSLNQSSSSHKSSSSTPKSEKSSSSSKRSKSLDKSSSSHSKRRKSSDETKKDSKERKSKSMSQKGLISQAIKNMKEENKKLFKEMFDQLRDETKKMVETILSSRESTDLNNSKSSCNDSLVFDEEAVMKEFAMLGEPFDFHCVNGNWIRKCEFKYFIDPKDNVMKCRKIADYSHLAELPFEKDSYCKNSSKEEQKVGNEPKLIPKTEIPMHEMEHSLLLPNESFTMRPIKTEAIDDEEILTKPVSVFSTPALPQYLPDSKPSLRINQIKSEPQPHCSKDNLPIKIKQELSEDSKEYFKVIPQNSEISINVDSLKSKKLADMSLINKWIASQNKNHGFKDKETLNLMMSKSSLFSLFKCMGINCCYTTISYENFLDHLNIHMEENCSIKDYFLNCPYCLDKSSCPIDLIEHYKHVHYNCIYQCNLCFYRAAEQQSVFDHQVHYHIKDSKNHKILECPNVFPRDEKIEECKSMKKVKDIKEHLTCELCFEEFIIPEDYVKHLKSSHQLAEEKDKAEEQVNKMNADFTNNRIGKYQCLDCESTKPFGSNSRIEMRSHLQQHPRALHYVCVRETNQYKHMRIKSRGDLQVTKYNGDLEVLRNAEGILKISAM
ncbi:transcriptional regulator ATRX homolog [Chironomus tepperi]|uniref:transcriptional regulator ATRX homolog n=1 Tax=Chironomus tepperi TaxID=113505 RepID=UPI00391F18B8